MISSSSRQRGLVAQARRGRQPWSSSLVARCPGPTSYIRSRSAATPSASTSLTRLPCASRVRSSDPGPTAAADGHHPAGGGVDGDRVAAVDDPQRGQRLEPAADALEVAAAGRRAPS